MAARCSMCLLKLFGKHTQKTLQTDVSRRFFNSKCISQNSPLKNPVTLCRNYSISHRLNTSNNRDIKILSEQILNAKLTATEPSKQSSGDGKSEHSNASSEEKKKRDNFNKRTMKYTFIAFGSMFTGMLGLVVYEWGSPHLDDEGNMISDEFSHMPTVKAYVMRTYKEMMYYDKLIKDPSREKLLPEPLTDPYFQPPYTLILEMTGILVHPDWTYKTGWRFKKRPGVDYFLQQIGPPLFEVVIFTSEQGFTAYPILDTLDPNGYIMYRLFRDATRYVDGHHVKDLSCLNRDLSKVIFIDWDEKSFALQDKNALKLKRWSGNDDDKTLYDLASLLRTIAASEVEDVRTVLEYYNQFDDPVAVYKENQRKLQEEEEKRNQEERGKKSTLVSTWSSNLRGRR